MVFVPGLELTRALREQGIDRSEIRTLLGAGDLVRVRRGAYARNPTKDLATTHRREVAAALAACSDVWVSHTSAALLHGLPFWPGDLAAVHLTKSRSTGGRRRAGVHVHVQPVPSPDAAVIDGHPVTSLARTVADCLRMLDFEHAVMLGDGAMRKGLDADELQRVLSAASGRTGSGRARVAALFLDGRAESEGESRSRAVLARGGIPVPELQFIVRDRRGTVVARTDFGWPQLRTIGEFDGMVKYGRLVPAGDAPGDVVFREKIREDMLRDLGWQVVRWTWSELDHPAVIYERLHRAFVRGRTQAA